MNAVELLRAAAPSRRPAQDYVAEAVEAFLAAGSPPVMCVNAGTGIGKTLAYAAPALLAAHNGRKTVISTHTVQQMDQVWAALNRLAGALPGPAALARRLGRANFLSRGRIARMLANRDDMDGDARALLKEAMAHAGLIDAFEAECGALPVPRADICLTSSCADQSAWLSQREETEAAGIVLQTHAMSVLDAARGAVAADIVIYDEGDALPSAAAGFAEARVAPLDLLSIAERQAPAGLEAAMATFEAWAESAIGPDGAVFRQDRPEAADHARAVRAALADAEGDHARDLRRALSAFIRLDPARSYRGAAVTAAPGGHAFEVLALDPGRILRRTYTARKTMFASATLAPGSGDFEPFLHSVGAEDLDMRPICAEPLEGFGAMAFALADRSAPAPFLDGGARNPGFDDYAASAVRTAMAEGGRVLALAPSFADAEALGRRVPRLAVHRRGEPLAPCLEALRAAPDGALATPAAWAGTDLPGLLRHVVIARVPFPPPEAGRRELLRRLLASRGYSGANADGIMFARSRREAVRRLAQGLGRGVRAPDDRVKVWITDPRFPLPGTLADDPRRLLSQGLAAKHGYLAAAVPPRFAEAYENAEIMPLDGGLS